MAEITEDTQDRSDQWSLLLPELLQLINRKLSDTGDFVRFRAVCTAWRSAAPLCNPPPQIPWLLQRWATTPSYHLVRPQVRFYSHSSGRMYKLRIAGRRSWVLGSGMSQGYTIAFVDLSWTMLFNPFTGEGRALPLAPFMPWRDGVFSVLSDGEAGLVVVNTCVHRRYFAFCFCRPGVEPAWKVFKKLDNLGSTAYHDRRFYANTACKTTLAIDAATLAIETAVPRPPEENFCSTHGDYLVGSRGKLFRAIKQLRSETEGELATDFFFSVYQLDVNAADGTTIWTKVDNIGDVVLFFDDYGHGISLELNSAAGLRRDCIYFMHENKTWLRTIWDDDRFLCRYSMEDGRVDKTVPLGDAFANTWIVPSLCHSDE